MNFPTRTFNAVSLVTIIIAAILMIGGIAYYIQQENNRRAIETQTSRTNQLIDQVKTLTLEVKGLSEENKRLSEQNKNYAYCNAVLLARYTQTRQPIVIEDLDRCALTSFVQPTPNRSFSLQQTANPQNTSQNPQTPPQTPQNPPQNPQSPPQTPQAPSQAPIVTVPNLLELNTPCLNILGLVKTCQ